jgi:hypothetical protein
MGKTTGPTVLMFKKFQNAWPKINVHNFRSGIENEKVMRHLNQGDISRILDFVRNTLSEQQPREDYRELLELTAIFLGETPSREISFRVPGAFHHARWMAKAIYCLKIFLFRDEFVLSQKEQNAICDICIFIVSVYIEAAAKAPYQDFRVLSKLFAYQAIDRDISYVALQKLSNHLWYLSPEVVALAFFDPNLPFESKMKMVNALNRETELSIKNEKRIQILIDEIPEIINDGIEQFVSSETREFFKRFDLNDEFLMTDPSTWHQNESFVKGLELVNKLKVVNDSAERGVKLMEDYNKLFTKNEQQKQYVLQIVSDYRRKFPNSKKATLSLRQDL